VNLRFLCDALASVCAANLRAGKVVPEQWATAEPQDAVPGEALVDLGAEPGKAYRVRLYMKGVERRLAWWPVEAREPE